MQLVRKRTEEGIEGGKGREGRKGGREEGEGIEEGRKGGKPNTSAPQRRAVGDE